MEEKECIGCGILFTPTNNRILYCDECRADGKGYRSKNHYDKMEQQFANRVRLNTIYDKICKDCGKPFKTNNIHRDFCSPTCETHYNRMRLKCVYCGTLIHTLRDVSEMNPHDHWIYCNDACRQKDKEQRAKQKYGIKICPTCGKEFSKSSTYCCNECYKQRPIKSPPPKQKPTCPDLLDVDYGMVLNVKNIPSKPIKPDKNKIAAEKKEKYVKENGLCGICKTSYKDCERMKTNFIYSPDGAIFDGNKIIKCPKFK